jgi:hypothetical protein
MFTYLNKLQNLYLDKQVVRLEDSLNLKGNWFDPNLRYKLCCSNLTSIVKTCFETQFYTPDTL